jgi:pilus assembly protein CpaB
MRRPVVIIGIGVVFAAVAGFMTLGFLRRQASVPEQASIETRAVVVALATIGRGEAVEPTDVKVVDWPAESAPTGSYGTIEDVIGKLARTEIYQNDPLTSAKFLETKSRSILSVFIPAGRRAMSIKVNEVTGISGFVAPGSHVDVLLSVSGSQEEPARTRIVLEDTEVLAIAQSIEQLDSRPVVVNTVTLNVSPQEAETLTLASNEGSLHLALRNDGDEKRVYSRGTTIDQVIGLAVGTGNGPSVELIRGLERVNLTF